MQQGVNKFTACQFTACQKYLTRIVQSAHCCAVTDVGNHTFSMSAAKPAAGITSTGLLIIPQA